MEPAAGDAHQSGTGAARKKRRAYTAQEKLQAINFLDEIESVRKTILHVFPDLAPAYYDSRRKLILGWRERKKKIEEDCTSKHGTLKKARPLGVATALPEEAEHELVEWVNGMRKAGLPVSSLMLQLEAIDVAVEHGLTSFAASWSWRRRFMERYKFSLRARTRQGQTAPEQLDKTAMEFAALVIKTMQELGISVVHNADQTATFFEYLPKKTINKKGEKTVRVRCAGKEKERATTMLLGDSSGKKYRPFIVFKAAVSQNSERREENFRLRNGFGRTVWKEISAVQKKEDIQIYGNTKAWWNGYLSLQFLKYHFAARQDLSKPVLLLLDDFSGHWTHEVVEFAASINVVLLRVPPGATSVCQPADVAWMRPLKEKMRGFWVDNLCEQLKTRDTSRPFIMAAPKRPLISTWVCCAWEEVTRETIISGYSRAHIVTVDIVDTNSASDVVLELERLCQTDEAVGAVFSDDDISATVADSELN